MRNLIIVFLIVFCINSAFAQDRYLRMGAGTSIGTNYGYDQINYDGEYILTTKDYRPGNGFKAYGAYEHFLNDHVGIVLELNYSKGKKYKFTNSYNDLVSADSTGYMGYSDDTYNNSMYYVIPAIRFGNLGNIGSVYVQTGLVLGFGKMQYESSYDLVKFSDNSSNDITTSYTANTGAHIGLKSSIGFDYELGNGMLIFGEVFHMSLNIKPSKWNIDYYKENDVNITSELSEFYKTTEHATSVQTSVNLDESQKLPQEVIPFSNYGAIIGIAFDLQHKGDVVKKSKNRSRRTNTNQYDYSAPPSGIAPR